MKSNRITISGNMTVKEHDISFSVECSVENDGIGAYEYWGSKGFDQGTNYLVPAGEAECYMVRNGRKRKVRESESISSAIEKYIDDHAGELENDCPEPEEDDYDKMEDKV